MGLLDFLSKGSKTQSKSSIGQNAQTQTTYDPQNPPPVDQYQPYPGYQPAQLDQQFSDVTYPLPGGQQQSGDDQIAPLTSIYPGVTQPNNDLNNYNNFINQEASSTNNNQSEPADISAYNYEPMPYNPNSGIPNVAIPPVPSPEGASTVVTEEGIKTTTYAGDIQNTDTKTNVESVAIDQSAKIPQTDNINTNTTDNVMNDTDQLPAVTPPSENTLNQGYYNFTIDNQSQSVEGITPTNEIVNDSNQITSQSQPISMNSTADELNTIEPTPQENIDDQTQNLSADPNIDNNLYTQINNQTETSSSTVGEPVKHQAETTSEVPEFDDSEPEYKDQIELKVFKKLAIVGLNNNNVNSRMSEKLGHLVSSLSPTLEEIIIDSNKGYGQQVLQSINNENIKLTGVYLRPSFSSYSDDSGDTINHLNYTSVIYSNFLERLKFIIGEADLFIIPEVNGLNNFSELFTLLSIQYIYFGQNKPVILLGKYWQTLIKNFRENFKFSEEELKSLNICPTTEDAIDLITRLDNEYSNRDSIPLRKVIDKREENDEREFFM